MGKTTLKNLVRKLPRGEAPDPRGFRGNISGSDEFVTDGHLLLLRSYIDAMLAGRITEEGEYWGTKPTKEKIMAVWGPATARESLECKFIGCATKIYMDEELELAVLRDLAGRIMVVDPYLLRFAVRAVRPDSMWLAAGAKYYETYLTLKQDGVLVGALMPMKYGSEDLVDYDLEDDVITIDGMQGGGSDGEA